MLKLINPGRSHSLCNAFTLLCYTQVSILCYLLRCCTHDNQCKTKLPMAAVPVMLSPVKKRAQESVLLVKHWIWLLFCFSVSFLRKRDYICDQVLSMSFLPGPQRPDWLHCLLPDLSSAWRRGVEELQCWGGGYRASPDAAMGTGQGRQDHAEHPKKP